MQKFNILPSHPSLKRYTERSEWKNLGAGCIVLIKLSRNYALSIPPYVLKNVHSAYNIRMITAKFGGTAITPSNLHFVKRCLTSAHNAVVVSAIGKEHPNDCKATDLLNCFYLTRRDVFWTAFSDKYRRLAEVNGIDIDVDKLLFEARARALRFNLAYCMSLGEELSAKITAKYLSAAYIEAEQIVRFGSRRLRLKDTLKNISNAFKGVDLAVTGGFYGGRECSRAVFSRGGSDITGSLCAVATNANLYENWTDSYGVCVADPVKVADVSTVNSLSYDEMFLLAKSGAEVLHPDAVKPCKEHGIPIKIGNFYNPFGASTLVSNCRFKEKILSVTERADENGNVVTTVLHNLENSVVVDFMSRFFKNNEVCCEAFGKTCVCEKIAVLSFFCRGNTAIFTTDKSVIASIYNCLKQANLIE